MRDDDFFDKYVDSGKPAKKGSVKKDLIGIKTDKATKDTKATVKVEQAVVNEKVENEEIIDIVTTEVEKVKTTSKPRKTKVTK